MREITVELVFRNGSTPVAKSWRAQKFDLVKGEDVRVNYECFYEDGEVKSLEGVTLALGISRDSGGDAQIYGYPTIADVDSAEEGTAHSTIYDGDIEEYGQGVVFVSVYAYEEGKDWQPLPQSKWRIVSSSARPAHTLFPRGPAMHLIGLPSGGTSGQVPVIKSESPLVLGWGEGGAPLSEEDPEAVGDTASPGVSDEAARADHVHADRILDPSPAGSYTNASITVGADGRVTAAASGESGGQTVTSVKTGSYQAVAGELVRCDPSSGAFTVTLPTAVGVEGQTIAVKNVTDSENAITVDTTGGQTIDGASSRVLDLPRANETYVSDGANWMVL